MIPEELLIECKKGLNMSTEPNEIIDSAIMQKILTVKAYLLGGGVSEERFNSNLAIGVIVVGVTDLWNLNSGEIKFSPVFNLLATQLAMGVSK